MPLAGLPWAVILGGLHRALGIKCGKSKCDLKSLRKTGNQRAGLVKIFGNYYLVGTTQMFLGRLKILH